MKPLQGEANLNELRPRQGRSPTRLIYRRAGDIYVVLAVAKDKADFEKKKRVAHERGPSPTSEDGSTPEWSPRSSDKTFVIVS